MAKQEFDFTPDTFRRWVLYVDDAATVKQVKEVRDFDPSGLDGQAWIEVDYSDPNTPEIDEDAMNALAPNQYLVDGKYQDDYPYTEGEKAENLTNLKRASISTAWDKITAQSYQNLGIKPIDAAQSDAYKRKLEQAGMVTQGEKDPVKVRAIKRNADRKSITLADEADRVLRQGLIFSESSEEMQDGKDEVKELIEAMTTEQEILDLDLQSFIHTRVAAFRPALHAALEAAGFRGLG